jgi:NADP-dependent 3-hydroxy acid dehydrogenase YdfG
MMKKVILITGASSGFGYQLALTLLEKGHTVYAGARRLQAMDALKAKGAHTFQLDVTDDASVKKMVDTLLTNETRLDAVYTNAGYGDYGVIEEPELAKIKAMYEVNVFGVARVHNAVLPFLRKQGFGRLIITSSLVGHISIPGFGWYASTKHAIRAMSEALRMELKPFNISVTLIEPGAVKTGFEDVAVAGLDNVTLKEPYHDLIESFKAFIKKGYQKAPGMDSTIKAMVHAFEAKSPKWVYRTTKDAKGFPILKGFIGLKAYSKTAYNMVIKSKKKA